MPIIKSAIKRMRQTAVRRARNNVTKRDFRSAVKAFLAKPTAEGLSKAQSEIDTAVKKNILEKNTASRQKAQLSKVAKEAGVKLAAKKSAKPAVKTTAKAKPVTKTPPKATTTKKTPAKKPAAKPTPKTKK